MLTIKVSEELWDEVKEKFVDNTIFELELEHSLVSLSKWESIHKKPFLSNADKTPEELLDYIKAMVISPVFPPDIFDRLTKENIEEILGYFQDPYSATTFHSLIDRPGAKSNVVTSEMIYSWMASFKVPFDCDEWNLNRLLNLLRILSSRNAGDSGKKMSKAEMSRHYHDLNRQRRAELGSKG